MSAEPGGALSERELEILRLLATGVTNREIARRLAISPNTVKVHLRNIFAKLGVESRTEACLTAIQNGWVQVPAASVAQAPDQARVEPLSWPRRAFLLVALTGTMGLVLWPRSAGQPAERSNALSDHSAGGSVPARPDEAQRWSPRAALPEPRERFACASYEGRVYVIGGDAAEGVSGRLDVYDPASDNWETGSPKPTAASNVSAAVLGGTIYVPGGFDAGERVLSVVEAYDPATGAWRAVHPLPAPRCGYALAASGGKLYLFGGWDGTRYVADVLVYDPREDAWSGRTPMGRAVGFAAAATLGDRIYVVGGYDGADESAAGEVYDPSLEESGQPPWKAIAPMSQPRGGPGLVTAGRRLYAVGGGWNGGLAYNESYDPQSNRWQRFPSPILGQWRSLGLAAVESAMGTTLYAIGGWTGDRVAVNQAYRALLSVYLPGLP